MAVITSPNYAGSLIGALKSAKKKNTATPTQSKTVVASNPNSGSFYGIGPAPDTSYLKGALPAITPAKVAQSNYTPTVPQSNSYVAKNLGVTLPTNNIEDETAPNSGGSGGSGGTSRTAVAGTSAVATQPTNESYADQLSGLLKAYQDQQSAQLRAQQEEHARLVEQTYQNNLNQLRNAYDTRLSSLASNLDNALNSLQSDYDTSQDSINKNAEKALQEAYIQNMLSQRNLRQNLSALGYSGGLAESTLAGLANNYGNSRNSINTQLDTDLASLRNAYDRNVANARTSYNDALANASSDYNNYLSQIESARNSGLLNTYSNLYNALASQDNTYANALTSLISDQIAQDQALAKTNYNNYLKNQAKVVSTNGNATPSVSTANTGAQSYGSLSDIIALSKQAQSAGNSIDAIRQGLKASNYTEDEIAYILSQL
ncbi:MAG: hypothetical protein K6D96_09205 [Acetatifactor sp.]|nr:hypothetical protein [Acetatifactor sp.]